MFTTHGDGWLVTEIADGARYPVYTVWSGPGLVGVCGGREPLYDLLAAAAVQAAAGDLAVSNALRARTLDGITFKFCVVLAAPPKAGIGCTGVPPCSVAHYEVRVVLRRGKLVVARIRRRRSLS